MSTLWSKFSLRLEITKPFEKPVSYPVAAFGADFARNAIPKATVLVAPGRTAGNGLDVSPVHTQEGELRLASYFTKAKVFFSAEGDYSVNEKWPQDTEFTIFEGRLAGTGVQQMNGRMHLAVHLHHWLVDLTFGSALAAINHVGNPIDFSGPAVFSLNPAAGVDDRPMGMFQSALGVSVTGGDVGQDLWGRVLKRVLCRLASEPPMKFNGGLGRLETCVGLHQAPINQAVLDALRRIDGLSENNACNRANACYAPELGMDGVAAMPPEVTGAIAQAVGADAVESYLTHTAWDKLLQYASEFMFSVVPLVDHAIAVPHFPTLRSTYCHSVTVDEGDMYSFTGSINRPIRAVAVAFSVKSSTNVFDTDVAEIADIGGCYTPTVPDPNGLVYQIRAPRWLDNVSVSGLSARRSTGLKDNIAPNGAIFPKPVNGALNNRPKEVLDGAQALLNGYAHAVYLSEVLRGRTGRVEGKLRFDIAPGSIINVESYSDPFLRGDPLSTSLICSVTAVSIGINAESSKAGTGFTLDHCRTIEENDSDERAADKHPLYSEIFTGAPLKAELQFGSCCK